MLTAVVVSVILAAAAAQSFPPVDLPSSCAAILCPVGTVCREEPNKNGVIQARCVEAPAGQKPGKCPSPDPLSFGVCASMCSHDRECDGDEKCCKNSCGALTCQQPRPSCDNMICRPGQKCEMQDVVCVRAPCDPQPLCVDVVSGKDWECPAPEPSEVGICAFACNSDSECDGNRKCCRNGCGGTNCRSPPSLIPTTTPAPARPACATMKCGSGQKCELQDVVCVHAPCYPEPTCVDIVTDKPGDCPAPRLEQGFCANTCSTDQDCKGSDKCCRNGCGGFNCQSAQGLTTVPTGPTCANVRCRSGTECVMKRVYCIRPPCYPKPVCVDIERPGECPKPRFVRYFFFYCWHPRCRLDADCAGDKKCCKTVCGKRCQDPETCATKVCPPDHTCVMNEKCDERGCSQKPVCEPVKRCPFYPAWINPNCVRRDLCSMDDPNACGPGYLCCSTDCGRRCVRPME